MIKFQYKKRRYKQSKCLLASFFLSHITQNLLPSEQCHLLKSGFSTLVNNQDNPPQANLIYGINSTKVVFLGDSRMWQIEIQD